MEFLHLPSVPRRLDGLLMPFPAALAGPKHHSTTLRRVCIPARGTGVMAKLRQKEGRSPWKSLDIRAVGNFRVQVLDKIGLPDISGKRVYQALGLTSR